MTTLFHPISRFHTSTNMTAEEIHQLGLEEVGAIEEEMEGVVRELGLNLSLKKFSASLRNNPDTFFSSGEEVLEVYNKTLHGEVLKQLPKLFKKLPKMKLELVEEPVGKELKIDNLEYYPTNMSPPEPRGI